MEEFKTQQYPGLRSASDRLILEKLLQFIDGNNIQMGTANGTKFGTATNEKIGFFGQTPVIQPGAVSPPAGGTVIDIQSRAAIGSLITALVALGIIA